MFVEPPSARSAVRGAAPGDETPVVGPAPMLAAPPLAATDLLLAEIRPSRSLVGERLAGQTRPLLK